MTPTRYNVYIATGRRPIVEVEDFSFVHNEVTFLFGESGIGKSMLCKAIYGLLDPDELSITVNGKPFNSYCALPETVAIRENSFVVFQEPSSHLNPLMRISEQLAEGSLEKSGDHDAVLERLWRNAPPGMLRSVIDIYPKPFRPSGGEKQRVLIAMAFKKLGLLARRGQALNNFFVFDEPTGSLDNNYRNLFLDFLFEEYRRVPFTAMVITHDYSIISEISARHRDLSSTVHFKELTRIGEGKVACNDFSPDAYISWLRRTNPQKSGLAALASGPVLRVEPTFTIFGKERTIYKDGAHKQPAELLIHKGEIVYVKAPSGVGKTTLAKIVMGLYHADKVTMELCGQAITENTPKRVWEKELWGKKAGMVFQHADEALDLEATVGETFNGLGDHKKRSVDDLKDSLAELFEGGVSDAFLNKKVKYLSGGQKQRLNLLRTIMLKPDLIVMDEPLNGLDFESVRKIIDMLRVLREKGTALFMISHNEEIFDAIVDKEHVYYLA